MCMYVMYQVHMYRYVIQTDAYIVLEEIDIGYIFNIWF